ncbi:MAG: hypothetical protein J2P21_05295 [Chloracidobacterium sp.]|nr:hypothetical protein [Chloracidobacterium sp.]
MTTEQIERAFQQEAQSIQELSQVTVRADTRLDAAEASQREVNERVEAPARASNILESAASLHQQVLSNYERNGEA